MPSLLSSTTAVIGEPFGQCSLTDSKSPPTKGKCFWISNKVN